MKWRAPRCGARQRVAEVATIDATLIQAVEVARVDCTMGPSRRKGDLAKFLADMRADAQVKADALAIVDSWNLRIREGRPVFFSPTLAAALVSGRPWLGIECGGCQQTAAIDCRTLLYDRDRAISSFLSLRRASRPGRESRPGVRSESDRKILAYAP
jgi:hypothetical protein